MFVGAGVEEVLAELGDAREGLLGPAQWLAQAVCRKCARVGALGGSAGRPWVWNGETPAVSLRRRLRDTAPRSFDKCPEVAPTPDEGPDGAWFVAAYGQATGSAPAYPAVQAFAAGVLAARCLREAGSVDDDAQLAAAGELSCATLFGRFRLDPVSGLQVGHQVLTVQWQDGERSVVWPPEVAQRPLRYPLPVS